MKIAVKKMVGRKSYRADALQGKTYTFGEPQKHNANIYNTKCGSKIWNAKGDWSQICVWSDRSMWVDVEEFEIIEN